MYNNNEARYITGTQINSVIFIGSDNNIANLNIIHQTQITNTERNNDEYNLLKARYETALEAIRQNKEEISQKDYKISLLKSSLNVNK